MAFVMEGKGSDSFKKFEKYCCEAYNLVRKYSHHLISIFKLMISSGMPEL